jgi:hypothetical protein
MSLVARIGAVACGIVAAVALALAVAFVFMWSADTSGDGDILFLVASAGAAVIGVLGVLLRRTIQRAIAQRTLARGDAPLA